jgi:membrane-associated phospholipid phosphatase
MRVVELVILTYAGYLATLALSRARLPRRGRVLRLSATMAAAVVLAALGPSSSVAGVVRDWLPALCILPGYWASGAFYEAPMAGWERRLAAIDRRLFARLSLPVEAPNVLELAYLSVYMLVPAGFAAIYFAETRPDVDRFWTVVVSSELACYGTLPWIQTRPPRTIEQDARITTTSLRRANMAVLEAGSVHANTFPSGHAAGAVATALAVMTSKPLAGSLLLVWALLVVAGSVTGRYHYAADAALGAVWAVVVFAVVGALWPAP